MNLYSIMGEQPKLICTIDSMEDTINFIFTKRKKEPRQSWWVPLNVEQDRVRAIINQTGEYVFEIEGAYLMVRKEV